jgi:hypothetical protein
VYSRSSSTSAWTYRKQLLSPSIGANRRYGWSVASSVTTNVLMIAETGSSNTMHVGTVFIYSMSSTDRTIVTYHATLQSPTPKVFDYFGYSMSLGTDAVFIGTRDEGKAHEPQRHSYMCAT